MIGAARGVSVAIYLLLLGCIAAIFTAGGSKALGLILITVWLYALVVIIALLNTP